MSTGAVPSPAGFIYAVVCLHAGSSMVAMQYKLGDTGRSRGHNGCDVLCLASCYMCLATKVCVFFFENLCVARCRHDWLVKFFLSIPNQGLYL